MNRRLRVLALTGLLALGAAVHQGNAQPTGSGGRTGPCEMKVVPCNYAFLYSGTFGWSNILNGPASQYKETVQVNVIDGVAVCSGSAVATGNGQSKTGVISGPGLFAVEWMADPFNTWVYRITAACPTPDWPAGPNGEAATPSQPAELGHLDQNSDKQADRSILPRMTLEQAVFQLKSLSGRLSYPAPETDPINGVTGTVVITWGLTRP